MSEDLEHKMPEHKEGYLAYQKGHVDDDCPYPSESGESVQRMAWLCGWFDARRMEKFGHLFQEEKDHFESEYNQGE